VCAEHFKIRLGARVGVRTTAQHHRWIGRWTTGGDLFETTIAPAPRAGADDAAVGLTGHRQHDHTQHRALILDQRDVDREFTIALDEFARSVQRVDHPQPRPVAAGLEVDFGRFLAEHGDVGGKLSERFDQRFMAGHVGAGQRAVVVLVLDLEIAFVDFEDTGRSFAASDQHTVDQASAFILFHIFSFRSRAM